MRPLAGRRLTALAISAVVPSARRAPPSPSDTTKSSAAERAARAPLPDTAAVLPDRTDAPGKLGSVTTPVTELVEAALRAGPGRLPAADAEASRARTETAVERARVTTSTPLPAIPLPATP
ncbi:hypothetical protein [Streptomyces sp. NPDC059247]|uniref:hypothetical protein n=1 Tax=Streptomyces sp. NPDC059247 TaxID=3346790 RepID=UPI003675F2C8